MSKRAKVKRKLGISRISKISYTSDFEKNFSNSKSIDDIECKLQIANSEDLMAEKLDLFSNKSLSIMFLGHLLKKGNPKIFLFFYLTEIYKTKTSCKLFDRRSSAYEIFSLFFHEESPLPLNIEATTENHILRVLNEETKDEVIRAVYDGTEDYLWPEIRQQLNDFLNNQDQHSNKYFNQKSDFLNDSNEDFMIVIGDYCESLISKYFTFSESSDIQASQRAILMCLELILEYHSLNQDGKLNFKFLRQVSNKKLKSSSSILRKSNSMCTSTHFWTFVTLKKITYCAQCSKLVWGVAPQGNVCTDCDSTVHFSCQRHFNQSCSSFRERNRQPFINEISNEINRLFSTKKVRKKDAISKKLLGCGELIYSDSFDSTLMKSNTLPNIRDTRNRESKGDRPRYNQYSTKIEIDSDMEYSGPQDTDNVQYSDGETKINDIMNELIHTERTHLRTLKIMKNVFYVPLMKLEIDKNLGPMLFSCIDDLISFHENVVRTLKTSKILNLSKIYEAFSTLFDDDALHDFQEANAHFSSDYQHNINILKIQNDIKFSDFLANAESNVLCRKLLLKDMLSAQFMRLVKYPLFFERLLKQIPQETPEYLKFSNLLESAQNCIKFTNMKIAETENRRYLLDFRMSCEIRTDDQSVPQKYQIMDPNELKLLFYSDLTWEINKRNISCHGLVFETDLVLLTKLDNSKCVLRSYNDKNHINDPIISPIIKLNEDTLVKDMAIEKNCFLLILKKKCQLMKLFTKDKVTKENWIQILFKVINSQNKPKISLPNIRITRENSFDAVPQNGEDNFISELKSLEEVKECFTNLFVDTDLCKELHTCEIIQNLHSFVGSLDYVSDISQGRQISFPSSSIEFLQNLIDPLKNMVSEKINKCEIPISEKSLKNKFKHLKVHSFSSLSNDKYRKRSYSDLNENKFIRTNSKSTESHLCFYKNLSKSQENLSAGNFKEKSKLGRLKK